MTVFAPWALLLAGAAAAAVVGLHLLARRRRVVRLPTTRFVPAAPATATSRVLRLSDPALLLLRVLALLLLGAAFARPYIAPERRALARVVMLDVSRAVADPAAARAGALAVLEPGDVLVAFDSVASVLSYEGAPIEPRAGDAALGSLSVALLAGIRAAHSLSASAEAAELVLAAPMLHASWDTATAAIRESWPGAIRVLELGTADAPTTTGTIELDPMAAPDDPLRATLALRGATSAVPVRIARTEPGEEHLRWAAVPGHVLLHWPADQTGPERDTVGAVTAGDAVVVAPWVRHGAPGAGRVVARWADGEPAATQRDHGEGCVREVAIPLPAAGDLALRRSVRRLVDELTAPCAAPPGAEPLAAGARAALVGTGDPVRLSRPEPARAGTDRLAAALMAAAVVVLLLETLVRMRRSAR
jgi:hypothetical protein